MAKRIRVALAMLLFSVLIGPSAVAQTSKARLAPEVDLNARLKEVESDPKLAEALFKTGRKVAAFCANCHGDGGNSVKLDIPNLAGQNPAYLLEQLRQFAHGVRRNEFMERMIKAMSNDEKIGIVLFYANQKVVQRPATKVALAAKGKEYYGKTCWRCHGEDGRGNETIARIAGQQPEYLNTTLRRYRGETGVRGNPLMAANTRLMTDADIEAVVAFVASMD